MDIINKEWKQLKLFPKPLSQPFTFIGSLLFIIFISLLIQVDKANASTFSEPLTVFPADSNPLGKDADLAFNASSVGVVVWSEQTGTINEDSLSLFTHKQ